MLFRVVLLSLCCCVLAAFDVCVDGYFSDVTGSYDSSPLALNYVAEVRTTFRVKPQDSAFTEISFARFDLHPSDSLTIRDGKSTSSPVVAVLTRTNAPPSVVSSTSEGLTLEYSSDRKGGRGFLMNYAATSSTIASCALTNVTALSGRPEVTLESHAGAGARGTYAANRTCTWTVFNGGDGLDLTFSYFDVDPTDIVSVYTDAGMVERAGSFTGFHTPRAVHSSTGVLALVLESSQDCVHGGFRAAASPAGCGAPACSGHGTCSSSGVCSCTGGYMGAHCSTLACGGVVALGGSNGRFAESGDEGGLRLQHHICEWTISASGPGSDVILSFERFLLEEGDTVEVFMGSSDAGTLAATLQGADLPVPVVLPGAAGASVYVRMRTGGNEGTRYMKALYVTRTAASACASMSCGEHGTCEAGACRCYPGYYGEHCAERAENGQWLSFHPSGTPPPALVGASMAPTGERYIYLFGGKGASGYNQNVFKFDVTTGKWTGVFRTLPTPPVRTDFAFVRLHSGNLLLYGGQNLHGALLNDTWVFNALTETWAELEVTNAPKRQAFASCLMQNNTFVVVGGADEDGNPTADVFEMTIDEEEGVGSFTAVATTGGMPSRVRASATCLGYDVLLHGGLDGASGRAAGTLWTLTGPAARRVWSTRAPRGMVAKPCVDHSAHGRYGTQVIISGGMSNGSPLPDTLLYDHRRGYLSALASRWTPRARHAACAVDGMIVLFGGEDVHGNAIAGTSMLWDHRASANASTVAVLTSPEAGEFFDVFIELMDDSGYPLRLGGDELVVKLQRSSGGVFFETDFGLVVDNNNGTYLCSIRTYEAGDAFLYVGLRERTLQDTLEGRAPHELGGADSLIGLRGSPFSLHVQNALVSYTQSVIPAHDKEQRTLLVSMKDVYGNAMDVPLVAVVKDASSNTSVGIAVVVVEITLGAYRVDYSAAADTPGSYLLEISVGGQQVSGSPVPFAIATPEGDESSVPYVVGGVSAGVCLCMLLVMGVVAYLRHRSLHPPWRIAAAHLDFNIDEPIASGAFAVVYLGDYKGSQVAIKKLRTRKEMREAHDRKDIELNVLKEESDDGLDTSMSFGLSTKGTNTNGTLRQAQSSFYREVSMISKLQHPQVLLFYGATVEKDFRCLVTEYMSRGSLYDVLHDTKIEMGWKRRSDLLLQASIGMDYLHQQKPTVLHKDIKSLNFLINELWQLKVADFGLTGTKSNARIVGTPLWAAPEVLKGEAPTTYSDVFSFGVVCWEVAMRELPHQGMSVETYVQQVIAANYRPPLLGDALRPHEIDNIITETLKSLPEARPSFTEIVTRMKRIHMQLPDDKVSAIGNVGAEGLLRKVFSPAQLQLHNNGQSVSREYDSLSLLYSDVVGFTKLSAILTPIEVAVMVNKLFTKFDAAASKWNVEKVETIGDAYIACAGIIEGEAPEEAAFRLCQFAQDMIRVTRIVPIRETEPEKPVEMRVGVHTGPVVGTVSGTTQRKLVWTGETVPIAELMESRGVKNRVQLSAFTRALVMGTDIELERRPDLLESEELDEPMETYLMPEVPPAALDAMDLSGAQKNEAYGHDLLATLTTVEEDSAQVLPKKSGRTRRNSLLNAFTIGSRSAQKYEDPLGDTGGSSTEWKLMEGFLSEETTAKKHLNNDSDEELTSSEDAFTFMQKLEGV